MLRTRWAPSGFIEPCLPSAAGCPPSGPDWIHEIKHDGFRLMVRQDSVGIRLLTGNGHDWSDRYPLIVEAKRLGSRYVSGRTPNWLKFKNPDAPAVRREAEEYWGKGSWR